MPTDIEIISPKDLSPADEAAWAEMRAANPALYSPYFHPEYTRLIGRLRPDAYIAIAREDGKPAAFFPYQGPRPGKSGFARPIGAPMTDYHGIITAPDADIDYGHLLRGTGIGAFHYSALIDPSGNLAAQPSAQDTGCMMDISGGAEAWRAARDGSYRRSLKSHRRRVRKAEDDIGPRRFEFKSNDKTVFESLITWKAEKFAETGKYDVLSAGWTLELLEQLWTSDSGLRCDMQALYFGDRLAAVDLGLSDGPTFHSWIVAYDGDLQSYAPGIQLLEGLIDHASELGYSRIDLGAGTEGYKRHYATEDITVKTGFIPVQGPAAALSRAYETTECFGKKVLKDAPGKLRRRYSQIAACDDTFSGRAKAMFSAVKASGRG